MRKTALRWNESHKGKNCTGRTVWFCQYRCNWTQGFCQQNLESKIKTFQAPTNRAMWKKSVEWLLLSVNTEFQNQKGKKKGDFERKDVFTNVITSTGVIKEKKSTDKLFVQILLWVAQQILEMARVSLFQQRRKRSLVFFFQWPCWCYSQFHIKVCYVCLFVKDKKDKRVGRPASIL